MTQWLLQSTAVVIPFGPFVSPSDGVTLQTGLVSTIDNGSTGIFLSKNGGTLTIRHASVTASSYDAYGMYKVTLDTTDTNTLGSLRVAFAAAASCLPVWQDFMVVPANVYNSLVAGSATLGANASQINGVSTSSVTTINANVGTTQPVNFTGTGGSALAKSDMVDIAGAAVSTTTAQIGVNAVQINGQTTSASGTITFPNATLASTTNITAGTITTVTTVTGLTASNLDTTVSSRMATYTQPTGFLAATFPSGTIANTTNITAGTLTTVATATNLTNAPTAGDFTTAMKTSLNAATPVVTISGVTFPTNFGALAITVGGAVTVGTVSDKTGYALTSAYDPAKVTYTLTTDLDARGLTTAGGVTKIAGHTLQDAGTGGQLIGST